MKRSHNFKDISGQTFNYLKVISLSEKRKNNKTPYWECVCICGEKVLATGSELRANQRKSCGCKNSWRLPEGECSFNAMYLSYKRGAKHRGLEFLLSKDEFKDITSKNCTYCGSQPKPNTWYKEANGNYVCNGVDRVNNQLGYILNNCVPCCKICNRAKLNSTEEEFKEWIEQVVNFHLNQAMEERNENRS